MAWMHLTDRDPTSDIQTLQTIITAISSGQRKCARLAGLFITDATAAPHLVQQAKDSQVRLCKLATFQENSILSIRPTTSRLSLDMDPYTIPTTTYLILIEKGDTPPINWPPIETHIRATGGTPCPIPWSYLSKNYTISTPRTLPINHPALAFLHTAHHLILPHLNGSKLETHSRIAGALGILPPDFRSLLKFHSYNASDAGFTPDHTREISNILLQSAITAYTRYNHWHKRDRYGTV
jgi:hypothetical protein